MLTKPNATIHCHSDRTIDVRRDRDLVILTTQGDHAHAEFSMTAEAAYLLSQALFLEARRIG